MKELFTMWRHTRMVVLVPLVAAVYVAVMMPFKMFVIIPGFTEFRPGAVVPVVFSLLFGPAAAWGSGLGNVIADALGGMLGPGSIFGFLGNFAMGYFPYKLWGRLGSISRQAPDNMRARRSILEYLRVSLLATLACGLIVGYGVDLLGFVPFAALGNVIFLNNFVIGAILGPPLLAGLYHRVRNWGLLHTEVLAEHDFGSGRLSGVGVILAWVGCLGGFIAANFFALQGGQWLTIGTLPFIGCSVLSMIFL